MLAVEMRMVRWMCGVIRFNRIRNEVIKEKLGVKIIKNKMREVRLGCFGHIKR